MIVSIVAIFQEGPMRARETMDCFCRRGCQLVHSDIASAQNRHPKQRYKRQDVECGTEDRSYSFGFTFRQLWRKGYRKRKTLLPLNWNCHERRRRSMFRELTIGSNSNEPSKPLVSTNVATEKYMNNESTL